MKPADTYSEEEMKEFFYEFLTKYRKLLEKGLVPDSNLTDFSAPCQIYVIWFTPYDQQYILVLHDDEIADKSIFIKKIGYKEDLYELENWINEGIIGKKYKEVFHLKVKEIIKQQSNRIFYWIKNELSETPIIKHDSRFSGMWFHDGFELLGLGIHELDLDNWLENTLKQKTKTVKKDTQPIKQESEEKKEIGNTVFSVYYYPTIWFGDNPFTKLSEYYRGFDFTTFDNIIEISTTFRDRPLYISKNGLLSLVSDKKDEELHNLDKTETLSIFNEFMSLFFVYDDEPATSVHDFEVNVDRMTPDNKQIMRYGKIIAGQRSWILQRDHGALKPEYFHGFNPIRLKEAADFEARIKALEQIDRKYCKLSIILLEAYDHYRNIDYIASYLLSWIVIENLLSDKWTSYIDTNYTGGKIPKEKRKEMTNSPNWTTSHIIRCLQIEVLLDTSLTNLLDIKIKNLRNILAHKILKQPIEKQLVSKEKAILILQIAKSMLKLSMDKKDWISFSTNEIKLFNEIKNNWDKDDVLLKLIQSNKLFI